MNTQYCLKDRELTTEEEYYFSCPWVIEEIIQDLERKGIPAVGIGELIDPKTEKSLGKGEYITKAAFYYACNKLSEARCERDIERQMKWWRKLFRK